MTRCCWASRRVAKPFIFVSAHYVAQIIKSYVHGKFFEPEEIIDETAFMNLWQFIRHKYSSKASKK
jgi:hypothetical protein